MQRSSRLVAIVGFGLGVGCHSQSPDIIPVLDPRIGTYTFSERLPSARPAESTIFEGQFTVLVDTVLLDATPGPCRYDREASNGSAIRYRCGDVSVAFDRKDPVEKATYVVSVLIIDQQRSCPSGTARRGCPSVGGASGSSNVTPDRTELKTGRLNAKRVRSPRGSS